MIITMRNSSYILLFSLLLGFNILPRVSLAQTTLHNTEVNEKYGIFGIVSNIKQLYKSGMYTSAISLYKNNKELLSQERRAESEAWGYSILSAVKVQKREVDGLISEYAAKYPDSFLLARILLVRADICFNNRDFNKSKELLSEIEPKNLNIEDIDEYYFKRGYSEMVTGNDEAALALFEKITYETTTFITRSATYFSAGIYFKNGKYKEAAELYSIVDEEKRYGNMSRYRILECKMKLGEYDYIIQEGERIFMSATLDEKKGLARILSEAFYRRGDSKWANYYFNIYSTGEDSLSRKDSYYAALLHYDMKEYSRAAQLFENAGDIKDSLGQSAYFNMGKAFVMLGDKERAIEAFRKSASSNVDMELKGEAKFLCTKLEFDLNRKAENMKEILNIESLTQKQRDELYFYIASSQIDSGNYKMAVITLKKIKYPDREATSTLQKVLFLGGMRGISRGSYKNAAPLFNDALKFRGFNNYIEIMSQYWLAECYYRLNKYHSALNILRELQSDSSFKKSNKYADSFFDSGYCLFKEGAYSKALVEFTLYLKYKEITEAESSTGRGAECALRIADCYYHSGEYEKAATIYEKRAIADLYSDLHIPFQAAISYGMAGFAEKKQALLYEILDKGKSNSPYYSNAAYELGLQLIQTSKSDEAEEVFKTLAKGEDTTFRYKALFNLGTINLNRQNYNSALKFYKMVVSQNPGSKEASDALSGVENIYQIIGKGEEFNHFIDSLQNTQRAERVKLPAREYFSAGERYSAQGKLSAAAEAFYNVIMLGESDYSESATLNYATISYKIKHYGDAIKAFETLTLIASSDNNIKEAKLGIMRSCFRAMRYERALEAANDVITMYPDEEEIVMEAKFIKGKSLIETGKGVEGNRVLSEVPVGLRTTYEKEVKR